MNQKEKKVVGASSQGFVKWFSELSNKDVAVAGGKGASLAEMSNYQFPIPPGFIVTAQAYQYFIEASGLDDKINEVLKNLDTEDTEDLQKKSDKIREIIRKASMPKELEEEITEAYNILDVNKQNISNASSGALGILKVGHEPPFVAVRSSATTEDLAEASFAGQQDSFLNVKGTKDLLYKIKDCFSSLFTARAIYYRQKKGFDHVKALLAVVVQRMIDSDKSGVIFSVNPVSKDKTILIEAVWGLGEGIVSGRIMPDSYSVSSDVDNFKIIDVKIGDKKVAIVRNSAGKNEVVRLTEDRGKQQVLSSYEIKRLAQYSKQLEEHYGKPQDIEFAIEGKDIFIVQSRPITTVASDKNKKELEGKILLSGLGASPGVASGVVKIIDTMNDLSKIKTGDVLVTKMTNPDMVVAMQKSAGIITDEGGVTSHASIVSREMGIPAVVGTNEATKKLKDGQIVTVDGDDGKIFDGKVGARTIEVNEVVPTKTKIKVIVDLPDFAERAAKSKAKGVGLVRLEGIIASSGKHPMKYVKDKNLKAYTAVLVSGLKKIAEHFEEVWIRSSDIRSDEYRHLEGAVKEIEGNPMLGDHGIRFSLKFPEIMKAEVEAIKEIAHNFPHKKIGLMVPQVISVEELKKTKEIAKEVGVPKNVKIGIMVETPAAVQIINSLCEEGMDFISFGTNDLTQYTLAIDRNNADVQNLYNEMNPAVLNSIAYVIRRCKKYGVESSLCGQAGSREDMVRFLISQGIDSISVNADAAQKVSMFVSELEASSAVVTEKTSQLETGQEIKVPVIEKPKEIEVKHHPKEIHNQDVEEMALNELGGDDYEPGHASPESSENKEVPKLNDAIPIDSSHLETEKKEEVFESEINLDDREGEIVEKEGSLSEEWKGEKKSAEELV